MILRVTFRLTLSLSFLRLKRMRMLNICKFLGYVVIPRVRILNRHPNFKEKLLCGENVAHDERL